MIQFNLLPDVKIDFIRAKRMKRTVMIVSILVTASAVALMAVMGTVLAAQKVHLSDLNRDISDSEARLRNTPDLNKILTIQNQLSALPGLYKQRPVTSRLVGYIQKTTPKNVSLNHLEINFKDKKIKVEGSATDFVATTQYADTLKFAKMVVKKSETENEAPKQAFTDVLLSNFDRGEKLATFTVTLKFDPALFDETKTVSLEVPNQVTTRSVTERPLFGGGVQ